MVMEKIKKFIEENWDKFSNLECSEVVEYTDLNELIIWNYFIDLIIKGFVCI